MTLTLTLTLNSLIIRNIFVRNHGKKTRVNYSEHFSFDIDIDPDIELIKYSEHFRKKNHGKKKKKKSREKNTGILIIRNTFHLTLTLNSLTNKHKKTDVEKHTEMAKEISNKNRKATMEELLNAKAATKELLNAKAAMEKEKRNFGIPEEVVSRDYTVIFDENDKEQAPKILIVISDDDSSEDEERKEILKRRGKENIPIINISDDSSEDSSDNDSSEDSSDNEDCVLHQKL